MLTVEDISLVLLGLLFTQSNKVWCVMNFIATQEVVHDEIWDHTKEMSPKYDPDESS